MKELETSGELGKTNKDPLLQPPTFRKMLEQEIASFPKNFRGTSIRLTTYIVGFTALMVGLTSLGIGEENSFKIATGSLVAGILAGECYFMPKLSKRFTWLENNNKYRDPKV